MQVDPSKQKQNETGGKTPFSAFFWRAQKDSFGRFSPLYLRTWNEWVVYIQYENFIGKTIDPRNIL
jgi:hypothetical protein